MNIIILKIFGNGLLYIYIIIIFKNHNILYYIFINQIKATILKQKIK